MEVNDTGVKSAAIKFLVPQRGGTVLNIQGEEALKNDPHVVRYRIEDCAGKSIESPIDNACYLGYIVSEDATGQNARAYAEEALSRLKVTFES